VAASLRRDPAEFGAVARQAARAGVGSDPGDDARLVLVVDQYEELFTHCTDDDERTAFATALAHAAPALVVVAVRADFYEHCTRLEPLAPALAEQVVVGPMNAGQLRRVVTEPARRAGVEVEPTLPDRLLADLGVREGRDYDPGSLPLLAHALRMTWQHRDGGPLTVSRYVATGGIDHAVADTAERIHASLDATQQRRLRSALLRMVTVADTNEEVRRQADRDELPAEVLDPLIAARLVTADADTVRLSHEALLTAWPRLRDWVEHNRADLVLRGRLDDAVRYWRESDRDESALYRGARLAAATEWAREATDLTDTERAFLRASTRAEQRATRRLRGLVAGLSTLLVIALVSGGVALRAQRTAEDRRAEAESRALATQSRLVAESDPLRTKRLALRAWQAADTTEARGALLSAPSLASAVSVDSGFDRALSVDVSPDGGLVAVGGTDGGVAVWDTETNRPLGLDLSPSDEDVREVAFSPDGSRLATASDEVDGVRIWEVPSGRLLRTLPGAFQVVWRPDGDAVAALEVTDPLGLGIRDPDTGAELGRVPGSGALIYDLAFNPSGNRLAVGYADGAFELWRPGGTDVAAERLARHEAHSDPVTVAFSPDRLATSSQSDPGVRLWDPETGDGRAELATSGEFGPGGVTFSPDGTRLYRMEGRTLSVWDPETRRLTGEYRSLGDTALDLAVSRDGRTVAVATATGGVTRWTRGALWYERFRGAVLSVAFAPDGERVTAAAGDGEVHTW
ncbi:nSTAND1 domain-containing NTPase, partial [Saccharomonospora iraqiensis]